MNIFVMRHGQAEAIALSDSARKLTTFGKNQAHQQAIWLKEQNIHFDYALVSPYERAQQTFSEVNAVFNNSIKAENWEAITPYGNETLVLDYLQLLKEQGINNVLIVSHLPLVGYIVAALCQQRMGVRFATATIAEIKWNGTQGTLIQEHEV